MIILEKKIPAFLTDKRNMVNFILFTAIFALVFINIYAPFGVDKWLNVTAVELFVYSSVVILIGMLVIVISRLLMHLLTRKRSLKYGQYALWIIGEISVLALVYAIIQWFVLHVGENFLSVLRNSIRTTAYIILIPYVIFWLYAALKDKYATLEKIETSLSSQDLAELTEKKSMTGHSLIPFYDEKGVLRFSIKKEDLLYIESADNYVFIHYLDNQKPSRYMVRNTLKRIEQELPNAGLVRSHRSYMVNISKVKIIRKEKEGLIIGFDSPSHITVPISKTYLDVFIRKLSDLTAPDDK